MDGLSAIFDFDSAGRVAPGGGVYSTSLDKPFLGGGEEGFPQDGEWVALDG